MMDQVKPVEVLLVEDDPGDVLMTREAFEEFKVRNNLNVVSDGEEAMAYLRREGEYADVVRPDLVLLDLNLPRMDGRQVLAAIKGDDELASIPVVVLTTSEAEEDVLRSYRLHANAYVTKPVDFDRFIDIVRRIDDFFVTVVRLPQHRGPHRAPGRRSRRGCSRGGFVSLRQGARGRDGQDSFCSWLVQRSRRSMPSMRPSRPNGTSITRKNMSSSPPRVLPGKSGRNLRDEYRPDRGPILSRHARGLSEL
jgi:CheY-like chemotaxis protein